MNILRKTISLILSTAFIITTLCACSGSWSLEGIGGPKNQEVQREFFGMNTHMKLTAYGENAKDALEDAEGMIAKLEKEWSVTDTDSEIYEINHSNGQPVALSKETQEIVEYALTMAKQTDGALEPTIYPVLTAWGFTTDENRIPEESELSEILAHVGYEKVKLTDNQIQMPAGMELDLGAVGKGYAGDELTKLLKESGVSSALLDLGGNIQTVGSKPDNSDWRLGIRSPFGEGAIGVLTVSGDAAIVTSGNYERYFVGEDGKEYGHIIDPDTGYPVDNELASVTIVAEEGKLADALSTSMMVKGLEGAAEYWRDHQDFEMIAVTKDGEVHLTPSVKEDFSVSGDFSNMKIKDIK